MLDSISANCDAWKRRCLIAGGIGIALTVALAFVAPIDAAAGYLVGYVFWWGIGVGSLGLMLLYHMTGGAWAVMLRPAHESAIKTIPLLALLFIPIALSMDFLYPWLNQEYIDANAYLMKKKFWYLNEIGFWVRSAIFFVIWIILSFVFSRSKSFPRPEKPSPLRGIAAFGTVLWMSAVTFAGFDWMMTLEPTWYSTIYGGLVGVGAVLTAHALAMVLMTRVNAVTLPNPKSEGDLLIDVGNLQLAFVLLWTYFGLSQFLIIWSGNLPDEAQFYLDRDSGIWQIMALLLVGFHFGVPFFLLLSRDLKQNPVNLAKIGGLLLVMHVVDIAWNVLPSVRGLTWMSALTVLSSVAGIGGLWGWQLTRKFADRLDSYPGEVRKIFASEGHHA